MRQGRVLVVDDDINVRNSLKRLLSSRFATIILADSADAAEDTMSRHGVDVAIIDERMPGRSGLELISTISEKYPVIRCVLLTGWAPYHKIAAALKEKKICSFLRKPWDDDELVLLIESLMDAVTAQEIIRAPGAEGEGGG